jgi:molybdopterin synthase sulfur carrier subunit
MVTVRIPTPLRAVSGGQSEVKIPAGTLRQCLEELEARFPGFKARICEDSGNVRRFVNIFINGEDIRFLDGLDTPLKPGDEVTIIPSMAGG